jgi:predicted transcriptional regulator
MTQMVDLKLRVGGSAAQDLGDFVDAWQRLEAGETVAPERVVAFESWEALASVMTGERYRLLRHLHAHPMPSVNALAVALSRQYRRVHADVVALEAAGLIERSKGLVRATADRLQAELRL